MSVTSECFTPNEAALAAGVSVADVNSVVDRKILPATLYSACEARTFRREACLFISFYFHTADSLTSAARIRAIRNSYAHAHSWSDLAHWRYEESTGIEVSFLRLWKDVEARLKELQEAQNAVVEDPEILSGTPVIRGTRIPAHDVAHLVEANTPMEELKELYPRLTEEQFHLATVYAKAKPLRGRPKRKSLPISSRISVSKRNLRGSSIGGLQRGKTASR